MQSKKNLKKHTKMLQVIISGLEDWGYDRRSNGTANMFMS